MSQMGPSKVGGGGSNGKRKTTEQLEYHYKTPNKIFESRSIAFMIRRLFVNHKVVLS